MSSEHTQDRRLGRVRPHCDRRLLARFVPAELNVKTENKVTVKYGTMEERRQALIDRGIDPDAIERALQPKFLLEYNSSKAE